jgi:uncharacterized DUF497 family protein
MLYEWDEQKNQLNFKKHSVWFEEAQSLWADSKAIEYYDDSHSDHEDRLIRIGHTSKGRLLLVVFCERQGGHIIRIISARKATKKEREEYEEGI